jgi:signal transduction histidine kinase
MLGEISIEAGIPHVRGHHDALSGALANILLNAVDACGMAGASQATTADEARSATPQVSVSVRRSPLDSGQVEVTVSDNGCGIAADLLPGIWDPYVTHKQGGTGLGLTIVRQTIEAHGGSVFARSDGQTGSVVGFTVRV